jgi:hypothetical protein
MRHKRSLLLLALCCAIGGQLSPERAAAADVFKVWHRGSQDLLKELRPISDLVVEFTIAQPMHVFISGHIDVKHRCLDVVPQSYPNANYPIGVAIRLEHTKANGSREWISGSKWGPNIASCAHHYVTIPLDGYICVSTSGRHVIRVFGEAHTTATPYDGVAELNAPPEGDQPGGTTDPYNQMIVRLSPASSCPR